MRKFWIGCLGVILVSGLALSACSRGVPVGGYIRPLSPGDPYRVLGNYPGEPDTKGLLTVTVVGKGVEPDQASSKAQAMLMAERAATADAYRKLAEEIHGIYVQAYMSMGSNAVDYDRVRLETETWLRGAQVLETKRLSNGITEVSMRARIHVSPDHILYDRVDAGRSAPPQRGGKG